MWVWIPAALGVYIASGLLLTLLLWRNRIIPPQGSPADFALSFNEVWFPTVNGKRLHGWLVAPAHHGSPQALPVLILVHGWGRNAARTLVYLQAVGGAGFGALAFDARNHGLSDRDGYASMKKFSEDIEAAANFLETEGFPHPYGVIGLSIGGSAALHAAACDGRLGPVVTIGAFAHPRDAMLALGFGRWLFAPIAPVLFRFIEWYLGAPLDSLAPEGLFHRIQAPVLLIHGERDQVVPVSHARRLYAKGGATTKLLLLPNRGHSDVHLERGLLETVVTFLLENASLVPTGAAANPLP